MGNQQFCNCNKVNSVDELTTEKEENKGKSINTDVEQKVQEWSLNTNGNKCDDITIRLNNPNEKSNVINEVSKGNPMRGADEKKLTASQNLKAEDKKFTEQEFPNNNEVIQCRAHNNFRISEFNTFNDDVKNDINFEDEMQYIYTKPKINADMKSLIISESFNQQLQNIDDIDLDKTKPNIEIRIEDDNNIIENEKSYSSFINDNNLKNYNKELNTTSKKTHFNRSGELIYYKSYDDKFIPINQIHFDTNIGANIEIPDNKLTEGNEKVDSNIDYNGNNNIVLSSPIDDEKTEPNPVSRSYYNTVDQSSFINYQNNLYIKKKPKYFIKQMNTTEDKPRSDPIFIQNNTLVEQNENPIDSIHNGINTTNSNIENLTQVIFNYFYLVKKDLNKHNKKTTDKSNSYKLSKNILSIITEDVIMYSDNSN